MTARIQLYLNGQCFQEATVELMDYNYEECYTEEERQMVFMATTDFRERIIAQACSEMRVMYIRQIIKCQYQYKFILTVESKLNFISLLEETNED